MKSCVYSLLKFCIIGFIFESILKKSFLNYLHLCVDYKFIEKEAVGPNMIYSITDKGRTMLNLFIQKNNWVNNMGNISPDTSQKEIQVSN
jgi:DNA-binding HxlR family transcriptional regulator